MQMRGEANLGAHDPDGRLPGKAAAQRKIEEEARRSVR